MSADSGSGRRKAGRGRWIAAGFLGAFAASVFTVIFTGLMVEGTSSEFDAGFHSVTLAIGDVESITLVFEVPAALADATLEVTLPDMLELGDAGGASGRLRDVSLNPGRNELSVTVRAVDEGSGYLVARIVTDEPVALERVFVTAVPRSADQ